MRIVVALVAGASALALAAPGALAHGGQYKSPGGRNLTDPTAPLPGRPTPTTWEDWWWANRDRYIDLARRLRAVRADGTATPLGAPSRPGGSPEDPPSPPANPRALQEAEILPALTRALKDPSTAEVRSAAAIALGKLGFPRSLVDLRRARKDRHPDVRDGATLAMGMIGDALALEDLRAILFGPGEPDRTRGFAALGLGFLGGDAAAAELLAFFAPEADAERVGGIQRGDASRAAAVIALGLTRSRQAAGALRKEFASGIRLSGIPRACAALALARLGDREAIPLLLEGMKHDEEAMRQCAAVALGVLGTPGDEAVVAVLEKAARDDNGFGVRQLALQALGRISGERAKKALRGLLDSAHRIDVPWVALALGQTRDGESAAVLRKRFREEREAGARACYALALGLVGDRESAGDLRLAAALQGDTTVRFYALTALGLLDDRGSAALVRKILVEEREPLLRLGAATTLAMLGDRGAVPALVKLARGNEGVYVRSHSCYLLGVIGDLGAVRVLLEVVDDPAELALVRTHAVAGLGVLADRSAIPLLAGLGVDGNPFMDVDPLREVMSFL